MYTYNPQTRILHHCERGQNIPSDSAMTSTCFMIKKIYRCVIASECLPSAIAVKPVFDTCLSARWLCVPPFAPRATRSRDQLGQHLRFYRGCVVPRGANAAVSRLLRLVGQGWCHVCGGRGGRTQQVSDRINHLIESWTSQTIRYVGATQLTRYLWAIRSSGFLLISPKLSPVHSSTSAKHCLADLPSSRYFPSSFQDEHMDMTLNYTTNRT